VKTVSAIALEPPWIPAAIVTPGPLFGHEDCFLL